MDSLQRDQDDFGDRLEADSYFADISVFLQRRGVTDNEIERALSTLNSKGGKIGAVAIVLKPRLVPSEPDAPGPEFYVEITVQVITEPLFNDGDTGTGKETEDVAQRVRAIGHRFKGFSFFAQESEEVPEGKDSYSITFRRRARDSDERCGRPLIDPDSGEAPQEITLTTGTPGAAIYFTIDGSYPSAANDQATLYSAPFNLVAAARVRAVATKDGLIASDIAEADFT